MKLNLLVSLVSLTSIVTAAATPKAAPVSEAAGDLTKREANGANCWRYLGTDARSYWRIQTWGPWDQDWGAGLLDNLRQQCAYLDWPSDWKFWFESGPAPTNGGASFFLGRDNYKSHCVLDAIWLASNGASGGGGAINGATCWESNKWW